MASQHLINPHLNPHLRARESRRPGHARRDRLVIGANAVIDYRECFGCV
jgi:hypothetical protein